MHYAITFLILMIYGGQVCPFLDSLNLLELSLPFFIVMLIQYLAVCRTDRFINQAPFEKQSKLVFISDLSAFLIGALIITLFNNLYFGFPIESGMKVLLAMGLLGFFTAVDLSLFKEWRLGLYFEKAGINIEPDDHFFSQPKKLVIFTSLCALMTIGVIFLVINKDLEWFINVGQTVSVRSAQRSILIEISFVVGIILMHIFNLVYSYSRNFNFFLSRETKVLLKATSGDFDSYVPIITNDEFGIMAKHTNLMITGLKNQTEELKKTRDVTILSLASLAETRDNETGNHILRTQRYVKALAEELSTKDKFGEELSKEVIDLLFKSAPLHDIGKVGIPDSILLKPGKLTESEFKIMRRHPHLGSEALKVAEKELGSNSFLKFAREIAISHHEKWDGTGYPRKLEGEEIPISGRLMALADVYDALISERVYKPAFSHEKAKNIIVEWKGINFDPEIVDAFLAIESKFIEIAKSFSDKPEVSE